MQTLVSRTERTEHTVFNIEPNAPGLSAVSEEWPMSLDSVHLKFLLYSLPKPSFFDCPICLLKVVSFKLWRGSGAVGLTENPNTDQYLPIDQRGVIRTFQHNNPECPSKPETKTIKIWKNGEEMWCLKHDWGGSHRHQNYRRRTSQSQMCSTEKEISSQQLNTSKRCCVCGLGQWGPTQGGPNDPNA